MKAKFLKDFSLIFSFCRFGGISRDFMKLSLDTFIWVQVRVSYPILANWTNFSATVCNSKRSFNLQINKIAALQLFWLKSVNFLSQYIYFILLWKLWSLINSKITTLIIILFILHIHICQLWIFPLSSDQPIIWFVCKWWVDLFLHIKLSSSTSSTWYVQSMCTPYSL